MKHRITAENAALVKLWLRDRGGILIWRSADLCDPGKSWTTPATGPDGTPTTKPSWQADATPVRLITDPDDVEVITPKLVRRFHVALRMGASGTRIKLTDASGRRVHKALDKAGPGSWREFDYGTQEALIFVEDEVVPLADWKGAAA